MSKQDTQRGQTEEASESAGTVEDGQAAHNTAAESREAGQNQSAGGCSAEPEAAAAAQNLQNGVEGGVDGVNQAAETAPEEKIAELQAQLAETKYQLMLKAAEFENFRKRMNQEKQNAIDFANQGLLLDIIPVIDDLERAIQAASSTDFAGQPAGQSLLDGITMIEKRLTGQLESKWGLKRFDSRGEPFDPNRHEALMMEMSADAAEPVVQEDLIKGYTLKDRVIRAAKVKVIMPENREQGLGSGE